MGEMADYYDEQDQWESVEEYHGEWPTEDDEAWHEDPDRKREEMRDE